MVNTASLSSSDISAVGGITGGVSEIASYDTLFAGTGRWAVGWFTANTKGNNLFGGCNGNVYMARRAGIPQPVFFKEIGKNKFIAYEFQNTALTNGTQFLTATSIMQPMKRSRWDTAAWTYRNAADNANVAAAYPQQTSSFKYFTVDLSGLSAAVTRIGLAIGFTGTSSGFVIVEITDKVSGLAVVPNQLQTATQAVATGKMAPSALVSNGGSIPDAAYVASTNTVDCTRLGGYRYHEIPVANVDDVGGFTGSGQYIVKCTPTTVSGTGGGTVDRTYVADVLYGYTSLSHLDTGADLYRTGYLFGGNDASTNEEATLEGRLNGQSYAYKLMGGGHGGEVDSAATITVDGGTVVGWAKTVTRARSGGVATLVLDRTVTWQVGDILTVSGLNSDAASSYNQENVIITGISTTTLTNDTITYANTTYVGGAIVDESTTADTAGVVVTHRLRFGDTLLLTKTSTLSDTGANAVATRSATITGSGSKLAVRSAITLSLDVQINTASYSWLATLNSNGSRSSYGVEGTGIKRVRMVDSTTSGILTAKDNSEVLSDRDGLGYIAWDPIGGIAAAVVARAQARPSTKLFMQDRTSSSGWNVNKTYSRTDGGGVTVLKAGTIIRGGYDRYDTVRPGYAHALLVSP